jgi:protein TonB
MDRHFTLPVAFSAALHGAVLFGFNSPPRPAPTVVRDDPIPRAFPLLPPPEPEEIQVHEDTTAATGPKGTPEAPVVPTQPEVPRPDATSPFLIAPPPVQPVVVATLDRIPLGPRGTADGNGEPWITGIIPAGLLDNAPRTRLQAAPLYPMAAKREGISGEVLVEFTVDESGAVLAPRVIRSTHVSFEEPSLRAVEKWKFEPGRRDGRIVRFRMAVPLVFNLNE